MESPKKNRNKRKSKGTPEHKSQESVVKKQKVQDFNEIEFRVLLADASTAYEGLEKFISQAQRYPVDTQYDLVASYCRSHPDCSDIFQLLENIVVAQSESRSSKNNDDSSTDPKSTVGHKVYLIIRCLQLILVRFADDLTMYKVTGARAVVRRLLSASYLQCILNQLLAHSKVSYIKATLLLMTTLPTISDAAAREVMARFDSIQSPLLRLLHRTHDPEDVKSSVIQFVVSFLICGDNIVIRQLMDAKGFMNTILGCLPRFRAETIVLLLSSLHDHVVCSAVVSKTSKIRVFNDSVLTTLCGLYTWRGPGTSNTKTVSAKRRPSKHSNEPLRFTEVDVSALTADQQSIREVTHNLLMKLCTSFKHGIIFHDKAFATGKQNANHTLTNFLSALRSPHVDPLASELVINSLVACPDVLQWYLPSLKYLCMPRPTVGCLSMQQFVRRIYEAQPLISPSTSLKQSCVTSQVVAMVVSTLVPPKDIWACYLYAIKGKPKSSKAANEMVDDDDELKSGGDSGGGDLASGDSIIAHEGFLMLSLVLKRSAATLKHVLRHSPWGAISSDVVTRVRDSLAKVFPPMEMIWQFAQQFLTESNSEMDRQTNQTSAALPSVSPADHLSAILRVLCGYHVVMPPAYRHCDVLDTKRLLDGVWQVMQAADLEASNDALSLPLNTLKLLAAGGVSLVSLLKQDENNGTGLGSLLDVAANVSPNLVHQSCLLLRHILLKSGLFVSTNADEITVWLKHLLKLGSNSKTVLSFFVSCINKLCLSTSDCIERVLEAVTRAKNFGDVDTEMASEVDLNRLNDIMDADELDLSDRSKDMTMEAPSSQPTSILPFSGLVIAAVDVLPDCKLSDEIVEYMDNVFTDIFYDQSNPFIICCAVHESPAIQLLPRCRLLLGKFITTSERQSKQKKSCLKDIVGLPDGSLHHILERHFISDNETLCNDRESLVEQIATLSDDETVSLVKQVLVYLEAGFKQLTVKKCLKRHTLKMFNVYLDLIIAAASRCPPLSTSCSVPPVVMPQDEPDELVFDLDLGLSRSSETDWHRHLFGPIFQTKSLVQLFLAEYKKASDLWWSIPDGAELKLFTKLSKMVTRTVSSLVRRAVERQSKDIDREGMEMLCASYCKKLGAVLVDCEHGLRDWTAELVDTCDSFLPFLPLQTCWRLLIALQQSASCFTTSTTGAPVELGSDCRLAVDVAKMIFLIRSPSTTLDFSANACKGLFRILENFPSDEEMCEAFKAIASEHSVFAAAAGPGTVVLLLDAGSQPSLGLAATLAAKSSSCCHAVVKWFLGNKSWKQEDSLMSYCSLVHCTLKTLEYDDAKSEKFGQIVFKAFWHRLLQAVCSSADITTDSYKEQSTFLVYLASNYASSDKLSACWHHLVELIHTSSPLLAAPVDLFLHVMPLYVPQHEADAKDDATHCRTSAEVAAICALAMVKLSRELELDNRLLTAMLQLLKGYHGDGQCFREQLSITWNQFVTVGLRCHFTNTNFLRLLECLVAALYPIVSDSVNSDLVPLLQLSVSTIFEMVANHSAFLSTILNDAANEAKEGLVSLLYCLVRRDVHVCQSAHLAAYFAAYHATLSVTDQLILMIIHVYEKSGCDVTEHRPYLWGEKCLEHQAVRKTLGASLWKQPTTEEVLDLLDKSLLQQSILHFPLGRSVKIRSVVRDVTVLNSESVECYDPAFILPLFTHLLAPECVVHCTDFAARHCLSYVLVALSSHVSDTRALAYRVLKLYHGHLEGAVGQHQHTVPMMLLYLMECLRYSVAQPNARLPCIVTIFLARAAHILTTPEDHMYLPICEFLLLKPNIDLSNVPEFYKLFYSSSMEYKQERAWILGVIADGIREPLDYELCEKRFLYKILLSFYDSPLGDSQTQSLVMRILHQMCKSKVVAWDLVKNRGLLAWLTHTATSVQESRVSGLVTVLSTLWGTLIDGRDDAKPQSRIPPCLPPLFTAEMIQTLIVLMHSIRECGSEMMMDTLTTTLKSVQQHALKTQAIYVQRGYTNPIPDALVCPV